MMTLLQSLMQDVADFLGVDPDQIGLVLGQKVGRLVLIWALAWFAYRLVRVLARRIVRRVDDGDADRMSEQEKRGHTVAQIVRSVGKVIIIVLAVLLSLAEFIEIGPLLAGAGIFGLAVSFGAQSLVKDVISGFFILMENQLVVGDIVQIAGRSGTVEQVTFRVVRLRDLDGILHTIPCGTIDVVSNRTAEWSRAVVDVDVGYGEDIDRALEVFRDEARAFRADRDWGPRLDGDPEVMGVNSLGESGVTIRTAIRTSPGHQFAVGREFRRRIKKRLDAEGIEIPFPQRTVHLRSEAGT